jgi:anti-sigma-K factor RskA
MNARGSELRDRLAAEYVLGTLHGGARARFVHWLRDDVPLRARVAFWESKLTPLAAALWSAPPRSLWPAIAARIAPQPATAARIAPGPARGPWWLQWFEPRLFGALAAGVVLTLALTLFGPRPRESDGAEGQLPPSYVGVLAGADGRTGVIVSSLRHGTVMHVKQVQPVQVPSGHTLVLWALDAQGQARAIGVVPSGAFVQVALAHSSETLFADAVELALSIEAAGAAAPPAPSTPFVYRGLCGKLWRVPVPNTPNK